jgi:hypothetical protein
MPQKRIGLKNEKLSGDNRVVQPRLKKGFQRGTTSRFVSREEGQDFWVSRREPFRFPPLAQGVLHDLSRMQATVMAARR